MGDLSNKLIRQTFDGLIKTSDEDPISATPKRLQDGAGNDLPVDVALGGMTYYGTQDFTNATVLGISGGGGTAGSSGTSGTSGVDGPAGTSGTSGIDGTSGSSGTSGGGGGGITSFHTGEHTTSGASPGDFILASVLIPGGTFGNGDVLHIQSIADATLRTGWSYENVRLSYDNVNTFGGWQIGIHQTPSATNTSIEKVLVIQGGNTYWYNMDSPLDFDTGLEAPFKESVAINWDIDVYLNYVLYIDGGDFTLQDCWIVKTA